MRMSVNGLTAVYTIQILISKLKWNAAEMLWITYPIVVMVSSTLYTLIF